MKRQKGFSLIELLIVVAIILIIAAIAIPNLLRARISANEAAAVSTVRTINTAEVSYQSTYAAEGYSDTLAALGGTCDAATPPTATAACLVDSQLAQDPATKGGYKFTYAAVAGDGGDNAGYTLTATATGQGTTGVRSFFSDQTAVIRAAADESASVDSDPLK